MTTTLDINTPRGRIAASDQERAMKIVFGDSTEHYFAHTPTDSASPIDGVIVKDFHIVGIGEVKSRDMTIYELREKFESEWLLTMEKLNDIQRVSKILCVPGFGFLYLPRDSMVLGVKLTDETGSISCKFRKATTTTQATCNGGKALRLNAFIDVSQARIYQQ